MGGSAQLLKGASTWQTRLSQSVKAIKSYQDVSHTMPDLALPLYLSAAVAQQPSAAGSAFGRPSRQALRGYLAAAQPDGAEERTPGVTLAQEIADLHDAAP